MPPVRSKEDPPGVVSSQQTVNARLRPIAEVGVVDSRQAAADPKRTLPSRRIDKLQRELGISTTFIKPDARHRVTGSILP